jgi:hypothetical protein
MIDKELGFNHCPNGSPATQQLRAIHLKQKDKLALGSY